jgi:hypothetical protein
MGKKKLSGVKHLIRGAYAIVFIVIECCRAYVLITEPKFHMANNKSNDGIKLKRIT